MGTLGAVFLVALCIVLGYFLVKMGIKDAEECKRVKEYLTRILRPYLPKFKKAFKNYGELTAEFNKTILPALLLIQLFDNKYKLNLLPQILYDEEDFVERLINNLVDAIVHDSGMQKVKHGKFPGYLEVRLPVVYIDINIEDFKDDKGKLDTSKIMLLEYSVDRILNNYSNKDSMLAISKFNYTLSRIGIDCVIKADITASEVSQLRKLINEDTLRDLIKNIKPSKESYDTFIIPEKYIENAKKLINNPKTL